jgi:hypothetical protein
MRAWSGLVALLMLAPAAGALGLAEEPEAAVASSGSRLVDLAPLGDVDGDGADDLAQITTRLTFDDEGGVEELKSTVTARSGRDFSKALWTFEAPAGEAIVPMPDLDGDGVDDLAALRDSGSGSGSGTSAVVAYLYQIESDLSLDLTFLSGRTGAKIGTASMPSSFDYTFGYVSAVAAGVFATDYRFGYTFLHAPEPGSLGFSTMEQRYTWVYLFTLVAGRSVSASTEDLAVRGVAVDGSALFDREFRDPVRTVSGHVVADLDGDGLVDAAVGDLLAPIEPLLGESVVRPTYTGFGKAGTLWSVDRMPVLAAEGPHPVGDLDGDGGEDLQVFELGATGIRTLVLSGKDGRTLADTGEQATLRGLVPFGDGDGDGKRDALYVEIAPDAITVGLSGADMKPRWTAPFAMEDEPMGPGLARDGGSIDFTGDGLPDLLVARGVEGSIGMSYEYTDEGGFRTASYEPFSYTLQAFAGVDGRVAWSRDIASALPLHSCGDLDGRGGADLCIPLLEGPKEQLAGGELSGATLRLLVVAGEDGTTLLDQVLRSPGTLPIDAPGWLTATALAAGDLDGDGSSEVAVRLQEYRSEMEGPDLPRQTWYLFGLAREAPVIAHVGNAQDEPEALQAAAVDQLPAPQVKAAPAQAAPAAAAQSTPGLPAVLAVLAVAGAALLRRRAD